MAKPAANYPAAVLSSYQEQATGKDIANYALTQKADVALTAIYAGAGLFSLTVVGAFAAWPLFGAIENQTTLEQMVFTKTSSDTLAIILRQFNGTALSAGAIGQNIRYIEMCINGKLINQLCAEITATQTELGTLPKGSFADVKSRFDGDLFKMPCRMRATSIGAGAYTAAGGTSLRGQLTGMSNAAIDGVTPAAGNRVFMDNGAASAGIWVITTLGSGANGVWDRATDFDADAEVKSNLVFGVEEGSIEADTVWELTTNNPIIIGGGSGTVLAFNRIGGPGVRFGLKTLINTDSPYTALATDFVLLCNAAAGAITINLPPAANHAGRVYIVKKTDATNFVTIDPNAAETIEGATTTALSRQDAFMIIVCDGSNWRVIGGAGDYVSGVQFTLTNAPTTGQYGSASTDNVQVTLQPGEWDLSLIANFTLNAATCTAVHAGIGTATGNNAAGLQNGDNANETTPPTGNNNVFVSIPSWRVVITAATTYYFKSRCVYSAGTPQWTARLSARRIR